MRFLLGEAQILSVIRVFNFTFLGNVFFSFGKRLELLIIEFFNSLSWGTNFLLGENSFVDLLFSNVSSFKANPDIGVGFSNMYLGGYFSVFGKQLDLLGIKFFNFTFWECILSFWERDSIY